MITDHRSRRTGRVHAVLNEIDRARDRVDLQLALLGFLWEGYGLDPVMGQLVGRLQQAIDAERGAVADALRYTHSSTTRPSLNG